MIRSGINVGKISMFSRPPVAKHQILKTNDPHIASHAFSREFAPHNIEVIGRRKLFYYLPHKAHFANIDLCHTHYGPEVKIWSEALRNHYLVYIPITGRIRLTADSRTIEISPGEIAIANVFNGISLHRLDNHILLAVKFRRVDLDCHAYLSTDNSSRRPIKPRADRPINFEECPILVRLIDLIQSDVFRTHIVRRGVGDDRVSLRDPRPTVRRVQRRLMSQCRFGRYPRPA